jgi:hypothetical protein
MRGMFYFAGVLGIVYAGYLLSHTGSGSYAFWTRSFTGASSGLAACALLSAAHRHYRGQWPFMVGLVLFVLGASALGDAVDNHLARQLRYRNFGVGVGAFLILSSALLLYSGHMLHRSVIALEKLHQDIKRSHGHSVQAEAPAQADQVSRGEFGNS